MHSIACTYVHKPSTQLRVPSQLGRAAADTGNVQAAHALKSCTRQLMTPPVQLSHRAAGSLRAVQAVFDGGHP